MATQRLAPDALLVQTNLVGAVTAIQDDPDSPDGDVLVPTDEAVDTVCRVSFPTPDRPPTPGVGLQEVRALVYPTTGGSDPVPGPTVQVTVLEAGVPIASSTPATLAVNGGPQLVAVTFNAQAFTGDVAGSLVEVQIDGTARSIPVTGDSTVGVAAVEWNATIADPVATPGVWADQTDPSPTAPDWADHEAVYGEGDPFLAAGFAGSPDGPLSGRAGTLTVSESVAMDPGWSDPFADRIAALVPDSWWRLADGPITPGTTTAPDQGPGGYDGTYETAIPGTVTTTAGFPETAGDGAARFDPTGHAVNQWPYPGVNLDPVAVDALTVQPPFTLLAILRMPPNGTGQIQRVVRRGQIGWYLGVAANGAARFQTDTQGDLPTSTFSMNSAVPVDDGLPHCIVYRADGQTADLWVDSVQSSARVAIDALINYEDPDPPEGAFGRDGNAGSPARPGGPNDLLRAFHGELGEVAIWRGRALSDDEIRSICPPCQATTPVASLDLVTGPDGWTDVVDLSPFVTGNPGARALQFTVDGAEACRILQFDTDPTAGVPDPTSDPVGFLEFVAATVGGLVGSLVGGLLGGLLGEDDALALIQGGAGGLHIVVDDEVAIDGTVGIEVEDSAVDPTARRDFDVPPVIQIYRLNPATSEQIEDLAPQAMTDGTLTAPAITDWIPGTFGRLVIHVAGLIDGTPVWAYQPVTVRQDGAIACNGVTSRTHYGPI